VPTLTTERLTLVPLGPEHVDGTWASLQEPEVLRLTGTHAAFTREGVSAWLESLRDREDRADWAILRSDDGTHLGEVVLNDVDAGNLSAGRDALLWDGEWVDAVVMGCLSHVEA